MATTLLSIFLGALIGIALGTLGGGGSILTVPALVYLLGQDPHAAVTGSLVIVGLNALAGATIHNRSGHVRLRAALMFGVTGLLTAFLGARLSSFLSGPLLLVLFAVLMLVVAVIMLRGGAGKGEVNLTPPVWWQVLLAGSAVGFLTGFLGVGGGFLIVPALVLVLHMDMRDAVGSSLVVIALNSMAGLLGHLGQSTISWALIAMLLAGGVPGLFAGSWLAHRLPAARLRQGFAGLVVLLGIVLLAVNLPKVI
ncbi:sulfite exporter TauE/SafE family protein [Oscillochloris sp. ZM17-4]|uniref:sulfite exporter TauE/SafE family protein n=1 Tax=Oscillochloris sp. ZM17-4 TaxID=2866714 RepID=UPI001C73098B|nr:sulfite exporter TauE/SafE family protein [Oscillochloris sp. ZM17-4]MBX0330927.1 sulfite exporter TauE/SafE family protein [Oscillochloris sp. ZM17-4]